MKSYLKYVSLVILTFVLCACSDKPADKSAAPQKTEAPQKAEEQVLGECAKLKGFIATKLQEGTFTYKTHPLKDQQWPEKKCQMQVTTKLNDTITLGRFGNGYLACRAVYTVTNPSNGNAYDMQSTAFAIVVTDSGKPMNALFSETPMDDIRSMMKAEYRPAPFTIELHNEGVEKLGSDINCSVSGFY